MQDKGLVRNPPLLLKTLAKLSIKGELALPQANTTALIDKPFLPLVPNTLDDKLTAYARQHGFSEAPAGFGYREYRSMLRKEREARLVSMEKEALMVEGVDLVEESVESVAQQDVSQVETEQERHIRLFNALLKEVGETGKMIEEVASAKGQLYVLEALDLSIDTV
jgi:hypothetical protein